MLASFWELLRGILMPTGTSTRSSWEFVSLIFKLLEKDLPLDMNNIVGTMRDAVNLNGSVLDALQVHLDNSVDVGCFAHMFNRTGDRLLALKLMRFVGFWVQLVGHSDPSVATFRRMFGVTPNNPNKNRWFYWVEQYELLLRAFPRLPDFLNALEPGLVSVAGMRECLAADGSELLFELTVLAHVGRLLGDICYEVEGDQPLIFKTYELYNRFVRILSEAAQPPQPVVDLMVRYSTLPQGGIDNNVFDQWLAKYKAIILPAREYLAGQATKPLVQRAIHVARVAAMWHPLKARHMALDDQMLRVLAIFFLSFVTEGRFSGIDAQ